MNNIQLKTTGKDVLKLTTDLFISLGGNIFPVNDDTDNVFRCSNDKVIISVTSPTGSVLRKHLIEIETPDFKIMSDMRYQRGDDEVDFESQEMQTTFSIIKMLLTRNDFIEFIDGTMQRSDGPSNIVVEKLIEHEPIIIGWQMD
jgi:hypothetical protein